MCSLLVPLDALLLDAVPGIYLPQQRDVEMCLRKFSRELVTSILQAHAGLAPQDVVVDQPLDLMLLHEAHAPVLSLLLMPSPLELLKERQLLLLYLLEPLGVQLPDLGPGDAEDLAEASIGHVLLIVGRRHQAAELELDDVIDLLF